MIFSFHLYLRFHLEPARLAKDQWWVATWGTFDQNGLIIRQIYTLRKNAFRRINPGVQSSGYSGFKFLKCYEMALMMRRTLKLKSLAWKILDEKTQREDKCLFSAWLCKTPHERRPDTQSYDFRQSFRCDHYSLEKDKSRQTKTFKIKCLMETCKKSSSHTQKTV